MFNQTGEICRFCEVALNPEEVYRLEVPLFERRYEVCASCRERFEHGDRELRAFEPGFRADRTFRWGAPLASDARLVLERVAKELGAPAPASASLEGSELEVARALADAVASREELGDLDLVLRTVDRKAKTEGTPLLFGIYAHATAGAPLVGAKLQAPSGARRAHLEAARSAYLLHLGFQLKDELDGRIAALHAIATLELADLSSAEAKLREYRRQGDAKPAVRDPRVPLSQALLQLVKGNLAAVDEALKTGIAWAQTDGARWGEVEALLQYDTYVRAVEGGRWESAKDALKRFVKLRPQDRRALFDLGHTFMKCALDPVAREVLASYHAQDPRDEDGLLLYATCLSRLGEKRAAWVLLRDDLETERDEEKLGAERRHLAGLLAHAEGHSDRALELLAEAYAREPDDRTRSNLVFLVQDAASALVDELTPEKLPELVELLRKHGAALKAEYGEVGLGLLESFVARELKEGFHALPDFGPELFDKVRFRDADATTLQAWRFLAQRKLGDAVRKARAAHAGGGRPLPLGLVLRFLDRVRHWPEEARKGIFPGSA